MDRAASSLRSERRTAVPALVLALLLSSAMFSGCSTAHKGAPGTEDAAADPGDTAEDAKGILAKGGTTASNRYVDPYVAAGTRQKLARNGRGAEIAGAAGDQAASPGPAQQASPSIAGMATEPTGVRAGSVSIFSSSAGAAPQPSAPASVQAGANGTPPAPVGGRVNSANTSIFSSRRPAAATGCGTDAEGNPLSC